MKKMKKKIYATLVVVVAIIGIISPKTLEWINEKLDTENTYAISNEIINTSNNELQTHIVEDIANEINIKKEKLNILYLDVGQADSQIILYKDRIIVIDTGNVNDDDKIITYLKELNINKIDYLIGTHIHEDHIGSMQFFVKAFDIGKIYLPYNDTSVNVYYKNLLTEILNKELSVEEVTVGDRFNIEDLECEIMAVDNSQPEDQNDASIVIEVTYKNNKFLFTGDATKEVEEKRKWNDVDVLKVGHHGSATSTTLEFVSQVKPEVSIISVGEDNKYNLPKESTINTLKNENSKIYRTDVDGTIQIVSDGENYEVYKIDRSFDGSK